jgi:hypothetical protein
MPNAASFATTYNQNNINCTGYGDPLCGYTLKCYQCNTGYFLNNGFCLPNTQCFQYAKYDSSVGGSFSAANCFCLTGFFSLFPGYCQKCDISCDSCAGTGSNQCVACPDGAAAVGNVCYYNFSYIEVENWSTSPPTIGSGNPWTTNVAGITSGVVQGSCSSSSYVFGYYGYYNQGIYPVIPGFSYGDNMFPQGATLTYSSSTVFAGTPHYGVHFRATLLFIDDWTNGMSILFTEGGYNRYQFDYQMEGLAGEYLCGYNTFDHQDLVNFWFKHLADSINLKIYATAKGVAWGIKEVIVQAMACDSTCASCTGPTQNDCTACTEAHKVPVSGYCQCDSANGYYLKGGICVTDCTTQIKNPLTYSCVSACSFPNEFIQTDSGTGAQTCVVNCPTG